MTDSHYIRSTRPFKARIGLSGYAALLANLHQAPGTIPEVAERMGWGRDTCYRLIPSLHAKGRLHISGWLVQPRGSIMPTYNYGTGLDVTPPLARNKRGQLRKTPEILRPERISPEVIAFCNVLDELETASSIGEVCEATGAHRETIYKLLASLCSAGLAYIERWLPRDGVGGKHMAMYRLGHRKSADYPNRRAIRRKTALAWRTRAAANQPMRDLAAALAPLPMAA